MVSHWLERLDFSSDGRRLITDAGVLSVPGEGDAMSMPAERSLVYFYICKSWINYQLCDIFWLLLECCVPSSHAPHDNIFTWMGEDGNLRHVEFDLALMSDADNWPSSRIQAFKWKRHTQLRATLGRITRVCHKFCASVVPNKCCFSNCSVFYLFSRDHCGQLLLEV